MPETPPSPLATPVRELPGVGPERAAQLARLEIRTVGDLLLHRPRRYEDRRHILRIKELELNQSATVRGKIIAQGTNYYRQRAKSVFEMILDDGSARLYCRWWNLPFMEKYFSVGDDVMVFGKPGSLRPATMDHPETEVVKAGEEVSIHLDRIAPIYPLTDGLSQRWVRGLIWRALERCGRDIGEPWPGIQVADAASRAGAGLLTRGEAVQRLHFPGTNEEAEMARERLALDEFIALQFEIQARRQRLQRRAAARPCRGDNRMIKPFLAVLGFKLTAAQTRVLREIRQDLGGRWPMRRLLQGDVGSGKTVVAACTVLMALESGFNAALMVPTEILARQHFENFSRWFGPLGVQVALQTGSWKSGGQDSPGRGAGAPLALTIGTHALVEAGFQIEQLGLVVIDEQHKFGVAQRELLLRKGHYPHLLVMTATPIPRTLGLTIYGDLDASVIDEAPGGRGSIRTFVRDAASLPKVWQFIQGKLAEGRQAYVVYPRVEDADLKTGMKAVKQEFERLQKELAPARVGLLHGRMSGGEKDGVMTAFRAGQIKVLLATSVIEVGVDVPNATVMLIENAEQFGLAQLHQLRGRIGRGAHDSYCILAANQKTDEARARLRVMEETADGFRIAEADLQLRGPGELLGRNQSGAPSFRFGDLTKDLKLVEQARQIAAKLVAAGGWE